MAPWETTSLTDALVAEALLARGGWSSTLHVGIQEPAGDGIDAESWLLCIGDVIVGGQSDRVPSAIEFTA